MYIGRDLSELTMVPLSQWEINELLYFHDTFSQLAAYLSAEGASLHVKVIRELESRGPVGGDSGAWDHASKPIYD
ncbi:MULTISPECIES: hypothetical protein [Brevibacillus]|jgi:hypothetical protein|uniref:hypothetical protein n=1 Tax=Brevibacillus TaxID=55080 RepID=UPI000ED358AA|nr:MULTISPECIES: hypothetical protein [Brevibacillus]MBU8716327.1 hypothetical protein [Brevibacillus parabrevis]MDR5000086.1 hypothetical protein [Brevibacillus parabrevis]MED2255255.1 hypothetical protein [Brevibacillus parabrevis]UED70051.1 hypothetical protein HP435_05220 [Brevibacillus sp. HD3.3A]WDV96349.1 hypothetical protein PSE45_05145 [Brevibacillus parabrevis]